MSGASREPTGRPRVAVLSGGRSGEHGISFVTASGALAAAVEAARAVDPRVVVDEVDTMPGFTPRSMCPRTWAASGVPCPALVDRLLRLALTRPLRLR